MKKWFQGRVNRTTYTLSVIAIPITIAIFRIILDSYSGYLFLAVIVSLVFLILTVTLLIFLVSVHVRRWHDVGKSGWFAILNLIPIIGQITTIALFFIAGNPKQNKYGKPPISIRF